MRRCYLALIVSALVAATVTPVGAQTLGVLELDEHAGLPGDQVTGQVDLSVVDDHCVTEPDGFMPWFSNNPEEESPWQNPGPVLEAWMLEGPEVGIEPPADGEWGVFPPGIFPADPPPGVDHLYYTWRWWHNFSWTPPQDRVIQSARFVWNFMELLGLDSAGGRTARGLFLPETFVFAFADIETQTPIGGMSNFSPDTGTSVEDPPLLAPDFEPGIYPVIATCIQFNITSETFATAVEAGAEWLEANDIDLDIEAPLSAAELTTIFVPMFSEAVAAVIAVPDGGPWVDLYCILDEDGVCHPELRGIDLDDDVLQDELEDRVEDLFGEDADVDADPAGVADTAPRFTG